MTKEVMTAAKAAKLLNVTEETIHQWINGEGSTDAETSSASGTTEAAVAPKREGVYTANSALRRAFAASQIMDTEDGGTSDVPDAVLARGITVGALSERMLHPDIVEKAPSNEPLDAEADFDIPPPEVVAEVAECLHLLSDTKAAFASAFGAGTSLMQRSAIEVLDALRGDLAALAG